MLSTMTMRLREAWRLREWWRRQRHRLKWERKREERVFYWKVKLKWKEKWAHGLPAWMDEVSMIWAIRLNLWLRIEELHTVQYPRYYTGYGSSVRIILLCQYLRLNLAKSSCIPIYFLLAMWWHYWGIIACQYVRIFWSCLNLSKLSAELFYAQLGSSEIKYGIWLSSVPYWNFRLRKLHWKLFKYWKTFVWTHIPNGP